MAITTCRECKKDVSDQALACPHCGAQYPAKPTWNGRGFEYKSKLRLFGLPVLHISFKYRPDRRPVPARGVIAIGQFAFGIITISQFGIGVISVSQFTIAGFAVAQFGFAVSLIAQFGVYIQQGRGQMVWKLSELLGM